MCKSSDFKTNQFKKGVTFTNEKEFIQDLKTFLDSPESVIVEIEKLSETDSCLFDDGDQLVFKVASNCDDNPQKVRAILGILFFVASFIGDNESEIDLLDDLYTAGYLDKENIDKAKKIVGRLHKIINKRQEYYSDQKAAEKGGPIYKDCSFASNLKLKPIKYFDQNESVTEYLPKFKKFVPVVQIEISLITETSEKSFSFQTTENHLKSLIKCLQAAEKEMAYISEMSKKIDV